MLTRARATPNTLRDLLTAGVRGHVPSGGRKGMSYGLRNRGREADAFSSIVKTSYRAVSARRSSDLLPGDL